ncbi:LLM class flavin-dependent oxidoreductase [Streptomyces misionensis]|uniref:LLM class flavin-dependent oxidoreductase n=1 Tax=Streptomyces misionensis TaxID=67331 RepID=A0A5C6JXZ3_9ACTN|nr:LLM class flavin-dependent oxidoreductase [Streptomyces misionensis]TWV53489.1 LLM class flavin-dependent oxidoreductase [Streptomyces misionensis]
MRVGVVVLPEHRWSEARRIWREVEEMGFDHAWTYDHLSWRTLRDGPWFGAIPTLTAAAAVTGRITLGTLVTSPTFRHPVTWAKDVMTLDDVSGGRFVAGIGAGAGGQDTTALGGPQLTLGQKQDRFREFVETADRLLRQSATNHRGAYYTAVDVRMEPGCVQRPRLPFALAATGPRGLALAAEHAQMWITNGDPRRFGEVPEAEGLDLVSRQQERLDEACAGIGRDPAELSRLINGSVVGDEPLASVDGFVDFAGRCAQRGFTDLVVHYPRRSAPFAGDAKTFERIAADALPVVRSFEKGAR